MIVVSDASPLIGPCNIGRVDLLPALFGTVVVPGAVAAEVVHLWPDPFPPDWIEVRTVPPS